MSEKIEVTIEPKSFSVATGDTVEATATLRNLGQAVDQFTVSIDGLEPAWYTLPVSSVALFPNDQDKLKISLKPPETGETKAGSYPFCLIVASQENPDETETVELSLEVIVHPELEMELNPQRIRGRRGIYRIVVNNPGDRGAALQLQASDDQGILHYELRPESLTVLGGGRSESTLEVRLGWMAFFGGEKEFEFQVLATLTDVDEVKTVNGQLVRIPWYRTFTQMRLPRIRLPRIRVPFLTRPPAIATFEATTEDHREFKLTWSVKRAAEVWLDDESVNRQGAKVLNPTETTSYVLTATNRYGSSNQTVDIHPLPAPKAKVSERIRASLSPTEFQVTAGGVPAVATLQLQNLGEIVDKFSVEIDALDESWYSRSASSVALMPQATDQVQISFQPPKRKGVKAKVYPFAVTVRSQSTPEEGACVLGQLEVLPSIEFKLKIAPYRVSCRRKGTFRINLANTGVSDANLFLEATDLDEGLRFRFKNENPILAAWQTVEVPMIARPKRGSKLGEKKRYDITVTAITTDGNPQSGNCELHHSPFIGSWRPILRLIRIIIVLGVIGVAGYYILRLGGGWRVLSSSPQTWVNELVRTIEGWFFR